MNRQNNIVILVIAGISLLGMSEGKSEPWKPWKPGDSWWEKKAQTASEAAEVKPLPDDTARPAVKRTEPGYYLGSFQFLPRITLSGAYDDNIFATDSNTTTDFVSVVSPDISINSVWDKHSLRIKAGTDVGRYWDTPSENYEDNWFNFTGRYDISDQTNIFGGLGYVFDHEGRDSPDNNQSGINPTTYTSRDLHVGLSHETDAVSLRLGTTYEDLDYDNVPRTTGVLVNDDRDRSLLGFGVRMARKIPGGTELFVQGTYDVRDYEESKDQNGYRRSSDGYRAAAGIKRALGKWGDIEAYAGILSHDFNDSRFDRVSEPDFSAELNLFPATGYRLTAELDRSLNETTQAGASSILDTSLNARLERSFSEKLLGHVLLGYGHSDFLDIDREDDLLTAGLGLKYFLTRQLYLAADYRMFRRDSNDKTLFGPLTNDSYDFERNRFSLSLGIQPYPFIGSSALAGTYLAGSAELGTAYVSQDAIRFGRYSGINEEGFYLLGNLDASTRSTGTDYARLVLRDAGLDSRSVQFNWGSQGAYDAYLSYRQMPSLLFDGKTVFNDIGASSLTLPSTWFAGTPPPIDTTADMDQLAQSLVDVHIDTERKRVGVGSGFRLKNYWTFNIDFNTETKEGLQDIAGAIGNSPGNSRVALLPAPVRYTDHRIDLSLGYAKQNAQFDVKYHTSFFRNEFDSLSWESPFTDNGPLGANGNLALAPDNQFHQVSLSGAYLLALNTRLRGTYSYGVMLQDENFLPYTVNTSVPVSALPRSNLDGKIYLKTGLVSLSSRPIRPLTLSASYRLHERDNRTPSDTYNYVMGDSKLDPFRPAVANNEPYSYKKQLLKLGAKYKLHRKAGVFIGYDYEKVERSPSEVKKTNEKRYHAKLKLRPTDRMQIAFLASRSMRDGTEYLSSSEENPLLRKYNIADQDSDSAGISLSFQPREGLDFTATADFADEDYTKSIVGLTSAKRASYTLDSTLQLSTDLSAYAFYSYERIESEQAGSETPDDPDWFTDATDTSDSVGLGFKYANVWRRIDVGADYLYSKTNGDIDFTALPGSLTAIVPYPDLSTEVHTLNLYADYRLEKRVKLRLSYLYEKYTSDDWSLDGFYPGTLRNVLSLGEESANYHENIIGLSFLYNF